jgi:hypothetical protein
MLLHVLEQLDARHSTYDASGHLAALVEALGSLRPGSPLVLQRVAAQIDRQLAREAALPSQQLMVTQVMRWAGCKWGPGMSCG